MSIFDNVISEEHNTELENELKKRVDTFNTNMSNLSYGADIDKFTCAGGQDLKAAIDFLKGSWTTDGGVEVYKKLISCYKDLQGFETAMKNNLYNYNRSRLKYGTTEAYEVHKNG